jgi:hypothetical protein
MPRNLSTGLITSLSGRQQRVADLVEIHLSTAVYFNNSFVDLSYDSATAPDAGSNNYIAQGQFIGLGNVQESKDLKVGSMSIAFTAVDFTTLAYVLNNQYIDRRVVIYRAILDDNLTLDTNKVFQYFDGRIKDFNISEQKDTATLSINISSQFADFTKISGRRTNNDSQQRFFPNDVGFEFAPQIQTDIKWGRT